MYSTQISYQATPQQQSQHYYSYPWSTNNSGNTPYSYSPAYKGYQSINFSTPTSDYSSSYYDSPGNNGSFIESASDSSSSYYSYQYQDNYFNTPASNCHHYCYQPSINQGSPSELPISNESIAISDGGAQKQRSKITQADFDTKILPYLIENEEGCKGRRTRHAFSIEERHYLLALFKKSIYPSREMLEEAAKKLKTSHIVIQTWFKNTRSKQKKLTNKRPQLE